MSQRVKYGWPPIAYQRNTGHGSRGIQGMAAELVTENQIKRAPPAPPNLCQSQLMRVPIPPEFYLSKYFFGSRSKVACKSVGDFGGKLLASSLKIGDLS